MKRCVSCNHIVNDSSRFCSQCGGNNFAAIPTQTAEPVQAAPVTPVAPVTVEPTPVVPVAPVTVEPTPVVPVAPVTVEPTPVVPVVPVTPVAPVTVEPTPVVPATPVAPVTVEPTPVAPATPVAPVPQAVPVAPAVEKKASKPIPKDSIGSKLLSFLLCVFMTVIALGLSLIFLVRSSLFESSLDLVLKTLDDDVVEIQVGALIGKDNDMTLGEYVSKLGFASVLSITEDDVADLLKEDFIREFAVQKMGDYISDVLNDTGDGELKASEIVDLLDDNSDAVKNAIGFKLNNMALSMLESRLESKGWLEDLELSQYRDKYEEEFALISFLLSTLLMGLLGAMILLLILSIFLIRRDKAAAFSNVGAVSINIGCWNLIVVAVTFFLTGFLNDMFSLGEVFYEAICTPVRLYGLILAVSTIVFGLIFKLIAKLIRVIRKRRLLKENN